MIWLLILGVLLWSLVHFFPSVMAAKRNQLSANLGNAYKGIFALLIVLSIVFIVIGWRNSVPEIVYNPPAWGRHLTMLLLLIVMILFGASHAPSRIRQAIRHPMLVAVAVWGVAHLLANGDIRSVILFGGMTLWAIISMVLINRRDGAWQKPEFNTTWASEIKLLLIGLVIYVVLMFLHPYFTGMPVM